MPYNASKEPDQHQEEAVCIYANKRFQALALAPVGLQSVQTLAMPATNLSVSLLLTNRKSALSGREQPRCKMQPGEITLTGNMHADPTFVGHTTKSAAAAAAAMPVRAANFCCTSCLAATCTTRLAGLTAAAEVATGRI